MRKTPSAVEKEEETHITEMLERWSIEQSTSEFASPTFLAGKKDGSLIYCIDFRALNKVTRKDAIS